MNLQISPNNLIGEIVAPPSKSYAHRLIIASVLFNRQCIIKNIGASEDVLATINCVKSMGAKCEFNGKDFIFISFLKKNFAVLDCNESGSTLRFLLPVCSALGIKAQFKGSEKLFSRPNEMLIKSLNNYGANIKDFCVNGKIEGNIFEIDGSVSSQYISGYLLALATLDKKCTLIVKGNIVSENYIDITIDVLSKFGYEVLRQNNIFTIFRKEKIFPNELTVEGDFSNSAFYLVAGVIGGNISISGLNEYSKQGDKQVIEIIKKFGGNITFKKNLINAKKSKLNGCEIDCASIPDLVQILSVLACFSNGKTLLKNIERLRYKESDRVLAIENMLKNAKINYKICENAIEIVGGVPVGGTFVSNNDHRTAMTNTILASFANGNSQIIQAESVNKSYPSFFKDFESIGGKANVIV